MEQGSLQLVAVTRIGNFLQVVENPCSRQFQTLPLAQNLRFFYGESGHRFGAPCCGGFHLRLDRLTFPATSHMSPVLHNPATYANPAKHYSTPSKYYPRSKHDFQVKPVAAVVIAKKNTILRIGDIAMNRQGIEVISQIEPGQRQAQRIFRIDLKIFQNA